MNTIINKIRARSFDDFISQESDKKWGETAETIFSESGASPPNTLKRVSQEPIFESASELLAREFAEPRWAVEGLLSEGATVFAGAPKAGKSFLALGLAVAIAVGGHALGAIQVEEGDVLYLALEDGPK